MDDYYYFQFILTVWIYQPYILLIFTKNKIRMLDIPVLANKQLFKPFKGEIKQLFKPFKVGIKIFKLNLFFNEVSLTIVYSLSFLLNIFYSKYHLMISYFMLVEKDYYIFKDVLVQ